MFKLIPTGPYQIIYADPPWTYRDKCNAGERGAGFKYDLMTLDELCAMRPQIDAYASHHCLLAMWWVPPQPEEALRLVREWGFELKTMFGFSWRKATKGTDCADWPARVADDFFGKINHEQQFKADLVKLIERHAPKDHFGMGHWTRQNDEACLFAVRGKPHRVSAGVRSSITAPVREHSQKPDEARDRLVSLMGDVKRIELFARTKHAGWDAMGKELA